MARKSSAMGPCEGIDAACFAKRILHDKGNDRVDLIPGDQRVSGPTKLSSMDLLRVASRFFLSFYCHLIRFWRNSAGAFLHSVGAHAGAVCSSAVSGPLYPLRPLASCPHQVLIRQSPQVPMDSQEWFLVLHGPCYGLCFEHPCVHIAPAETPARQRPGKSRFCFITSTLASGVSKNKLQQHKQISTSRCWHWHYDQRCRTSLTKKFL